jgi:hypothetical protein
LAKRPSWLWNTVVGLIIGLSLLRWLLQRCGSGHQLLVLHKEHLNPFELSALERCSPAAWENRPVADRISPRLI